jgi:hypothetical protein
MYLVPKYLKCHMYLAILVGGRKCGGNGAFLDTTTEGPRARAVQTRAPIAVLIAQSAAMLGGRLFVLPLGLVGISRIRGGLVDIGATAGQLP